MLGDPVGAGPRPRDPAGREGDRELLATEAADEPVGRRRRGGEGGGGVSQRVVAREVSVLVVVALEVIEVDEQQRDASGVGEPAFDLGNEGAAGARTRQGVDRPRPPRGARSAGSRANAARR